MGVHYNTYFVSIRRPHVLRHSLCIFGLGLELDNLLQI
jgi:hypothetical protein